MPTKNYPPTMSKNYLVKTLVNQRFPLHPILFKLMITGNGDSGLTTPRSKDYKSVKCPLCLDVQAEMTRDWIR